MTRPIAAVQLVLANGFGTQVLRWPNCLKGLQRRRGCRCRRLRSLSLPVEPLAGADRISGEEGKRKFTPDRCFAPAGWRSSSLRTRSRGTTSGTWSKVRLDRQHRWFRILVLFFPHARHCAKCENNKPNASASWSGSDSPGRRCHLLSGVSQAHTEPFSHRGAPQNASQELLFVSLVCGCRPERSRRGIIWG